VEVVAMRVDLSVSLAVVCLFAATGSAQDGNGGGSGTSVSTSRSGWYGGSTYVPEDVATMLSLPQFAEELKLSDGQQTSLQTIRRESQQATMKMWQDLRQQRASGGTRQFNSAEWKKVRQAQLDARQKAEDDALAVLDAAQKKRLQEVRVQIALKNRGLYSIGTGSGVVGEAIGLTDEQKKQLNAKQREIREELQKVMAELKAEMEQEALEEVLTDSQLQALQKVRGRYYEIRRPDYRQLYRRNRSVGDQVQEGARKILDDVKKDFEDSK